VITYLADFGELTKAIGGIITAILMIIIGAVVIAQIEGADLIPNTSLLNGTIGDMAGDYMVLIGLFAVIVVVAVSVLVIKWIKGMNNN
jgi:hypothetical protein